MVHVDSHRYAAAGNRPMIGNMAEHCGRDTKSRHACESGAAKVMGRPLLDTKAAERPLLADRVGSADCAGHC